ncbi:outer membrane protein with beta-barrel domain [Methylosinus sp. sav-2]|uniref:outer membrane protein n=1 Tax=Methylosinus sp. sav-2 TaxID=2485168 RepID=UPI00068E9D89|nr:outer membrane beta-barrel protein [Methylosinus sp. sav-2]TDX60768.1 outer membrane protein with beta-barrel domain [Methylosinus sp. sav-2]
MRLLFLLSTSASAFAVGAALAADLPLREVTPILPLPKWEGFYGGLDIGGVAASAGPIVYTTAPAVTGKFLTDPAMWQARAPFWATQNGALAGGDEGGFLGGFQIGYNYRSEYLGRIIAGVEADFQGLAVGGRSGSLATFSRNLLANGDSLVNSASGSSSLQYLGTVRARLGYLTDPTLFVYATGGFAFGVVENKLALSSLYANAAGLPIQNAIGNLANLTPQTGWTAGAGVEWMFMPDWSLKAEYLYFSLGGGKVRTASEAYPLLANAFGGANGVPADWTSSVVSSPRMSGSIARIGINYHFVSNVAAAGHGGGDAGGAHDATGDRDASDARDGDTEGMQKGGESHAGAGARSGHHGAGGMHGGKSKGASHVAGASAGGHKVAGGAKEGHGGEHKGNVHTVVPAGVYGAHMVGAGEARFAYTPSYSVMRDDYIGTTKIAPYQVTQIPWVPNSVFALPNFFAANPTRTLRNAPDNMKMQMHMFHGMFGVTDWFNVMIMGSLSDRNMSMTVFKGPNGSIPLGPTNSATQGWGDTMVQGLVRLYQDDIHHLHVNLGLSLPTGSISEEIIHMHPSGVFFQKRAYYGLQLGTGTYDGLFGFTYRGKLDAWSWGLVYRGRAALGENQSGYLRGLSNEISAWGAYDIVQGLAATGRVAATVWDRIYGHDVLIWGAQQGTVPDYQGGERVKLLGGFEYLLKSEGMKPVRIAVEAGAPVYQRLNGPQIGQQWELNTALNFGF